jgi:hypothetical protein
MGPLDVVCAATRPAAAARRMVVDGYMVIAALKYRVKLLVGDDARDGMLAC